MGGSASIPAQAECGSEEAHWSRAAHRCDAAHLWIMDGRGPGWQPQCHSLCESPQAIILQMTHLYACAHRILRAAFLRKLSVALKNHTGNEHTINGTLTHVGLRVGADLDGNPTASSRRPAILWLHE